MGVVLLVEDMQHRLNSIVEIVLRTLTDKEGLVRVVQVKANNSVLTRTVHKLCLIEKNCSVIMGEITFICYLR